ncbi:shikimate kinase [Staphylococcus felis]|uniref:Shikimate kinase n=3 Tax=Staphylococcus felis TaxID=46127 RepID=A0AAX1RSN8_9STAP|nr:shikimate kinase [Staphylococcus felis]AVP37134.1 shikimate kinase [Staphylococcus felis]MBH9581145.1 shikimate kinase [Staphylococcus felis]PNZ34281.1 shikimate kinase [Staphylococcus felis]QQB02915.1 shikimate kinase [Staphylococcus felis]REH80485.1 shikimate kinase [Staphylococcus felis]
MKKSKLPLILIGFMGSGKTTLGSYFSEQHDLKFVDLDDYIVNQTNKSIPEIFKENGEETFRNLELKYLKETINSYDVIATGGGIVENKNTFTYLKSLSPHIVWVDAPFEILYERIKDDSNRPNAHNQDYNAIKNLYFKRYSRYNEIAFIKLQSNIILSKTLDELNHIFTANDQY